MRVSNPQFSPLLTSIDFQSHEDIAWAASEPREGPHAPRRDAAYARGRVAITPELLPALKLDYNCNQNSGRCRNQLEPFRIIEPSRNHG
jgi:hypothetical protein